MYTCIYIHISVIHIYRRNHRDRMMVMLIWFGLESIRERGIIEQVREGEEWVIEVLIFGNCYPRGMHTSRKSGNDFSGQKQVSHCRETNKFTVNRNYHLFLCFATDNWIRSFFLPFFRIYIKPVRITRTIKKCTAKKNEYYRNRNDRPTFIFNWKPITLRVFLFFFFFNSTSSRRFLRVIWNFSFQEENRFSLSSFRDRER